MKVRKISLIGRRNARSGSKLNSRTLDNKWWWHVKLSPWPLLSWLGDLWSGGVDDIQKIAVKTGLNLGNSRKWMHKTRATPGNKAQTGGLRVSYSEMIGIGLPMMMVIAYLTSTTQFSEFLFEHQRYINMMWDWYGFFFFFWVGTGKIIK